MKTLFACFLFTPFVLTAQIESEEIEQQSSNIQTYTPSKLLRKGQWDIKWFNNLYTENKRIDDQKNTITFPRQNFFTSTLDLFTGVSNSDRLNVGVLVE